MIVGIPKESWVEERRVALTPAGVYALVEAGHTVIVQAEAGLMSGFPDQAFAEAGVRIAFSPEEVFARADLLVKVLPPTTEECAWIPERRFVYSMVHLGTASSKVHEMLRERKATAVGFELIEDSEQNLPVLTAMSEIAGMLPP